jgi:hypothetical protein
MIVLLRFNYVMEWEGSVARHLKREGSLSDYWGHS